MRDAITWAADHPDQRVDARPLALAIAWNELGEGQYLIPTRGDGYAYLRALAHANEVPWTRPHKNELEVTITGNGTVRVGPTRKSCRRRCVVAADHGWELRLIATPHRGHRFVGWRGLCHDAGRRCGFVLERRSAVRAVFARD